MDGTQVASSACIRCGECESICPTGVVRLGTRQPAQAAVEDIGRRRILTAAVSGAAWAGLLHTSGLARLQGTTNATANDRLLRPPAALPESDFLARCIRCGACMKACPTGGLQPALTEAGLEGAWTPILAPRQGPCAFGCDACSRVCPTGAIRHFTSEQKSAIFIGTARIDHATCLHWKDTAHKRCLVCDEVCPYDAIYTDTVEGRIVPYVNEARCVGCGNCEKNCPVGPTAAIRIFNTTPFGDYRNKSLDDMRRWQEQETPNYPQSEGGAYGG